MKSPEEILRILIEGNHSLVVETCDGVIHTFSGRGVIDLYRLYTRNSHPLNQALVADKAVGIGAAALMCLGKISSLITPVISQDAQKILTENNIEVKAEETVPYIINRMGTGRCPLEQRLAPHIEDNLDKQLLIIKQFLEEKGLI